MTGIRFIVLHSVQGLAKHGYLTTASYIFNILWSLDWVKCQSLKLNILQITKHGPLSYHAQALASAAAPATRSRRLVQCLSAFLTRLTEHTPSRPPMPFFGQYLLFMSEWMHRMPPLCQRVHDESTPERSMPRDGPQPGTTHTRAK